LNKIFLLPIIFFQPTHTNEAGCRKGGYRMNQKEEEKNKINLDYDWNSEYGDGDIPEADKNNASKNHAINKNQANS